LGIRGPKSKIEQNSFVECHTENRWPKKWLDSIDKQKRSNLKFVRDRQTDTQTVIQTDRVNDKK